MIFFDLTKLPSPFTAHKIRCFDGDTILLSGDGFRGIVRIYGIDAPERNQAYFIESMELLISLTRGVTLSVIPTTWDKYNRLVARLLGMNNDDIGLRMIIDGAAWHENIHAPHEEEYRAAQKAAKESKIGLWAPHLSHEPPWHFRRRTHQHC